jgi:hypothetical protein
MTPLSCLPGANTKAVHGRAHTHARARTDTQSQQGTVTENNDRCGVISKTVVSSSGLDDSLENLWEFTVFTPQHMAGIFPNLSHNKMGQLSPYTCKAQQFLYGNLLYLPPNT